MSEGNPQEPELVEEKQVEAEKIVEDPVEAPPEQPAPKKRGGPKGSNNEPKVQVVSLEEEALEPIPEAAPELPPKPKRQARPKAKTPPPQHQHQHQSPLT